MACVTPVILYRRYLIDKLILSKIKGGIKFLEIGCGTGDFSEHLSQLGHSGTAVDFSPGSIAIARKKLGGSGVKAVLGDFTRAKIGGKFDYVFMFEVLEHIKNDRKAIERIFNLLRPGGRLVFSVPAHTKHWGRDDEWAGHYRRYEKPKLNRFLEKAGFNNIVIWSNGYPLFNFSRKVYNLLCTLKAGRLSTYGSKERATLNTGIVKEGASFIKLIMPFYFLLKPIFVFSNLFLNTDLGEAYLVRCEKD